MPSFNIVKKIAPDMTFRTQAVINAFDIDIEHAKEEFAGNIDIENKHWNVGLIVGGSGTGKSTIAKECFKDCIFQTLNTLQKALLMICPKTKV